MNHRRTICSFVKREGRMTPAQLRGFRKLFSQYGLSQSYKPLELKNFLKLQSKIILDIGCGMGDSLIQNARQFPEKFFLGVEVYRPGVGATLNKIHELELKNVRLFCDDVVKVLGEQTPDNFFEKIQIFFPDPWPKRRHHKRRLINENFLGLIQKKLIDDGQLHMATDDADYAKALLKLMKSSENFSNISLENFVRPADRPVTKYEKRAQQLGHRVWDLIYLLERRVD